jgi:hypothetical protein
LIGGTALHLAGLGFSIDRQMGALTEYYSSQEKVELDMWQQPELGRLVGQTQDNEIKKPVPFIFLTDSRGLEWKLEVDELNDEDLDILSSGQRVRVLGLLSGEEEPEFHACAVFPWVYDYEHTIKELSEIRDAMKSKISRHKNHPPTNTEENEILTTKKCLEMKMVTNVE